MTFKDYWTALMKEKNIKTNQKIIMTKEQFEAMQKQAFKKGFFQAQSLIKTTDNNKTDFMDLFKNLF
jgi:hypothetical protein